MASSHQVSKSAGLFVSSPAPPGLNWVVFLPLCLSFCSCWNTPIMCFIHCILKCCFSFSPLTGPSFLYHSDALFSHLKKHKSKTSQHPHSPTIHSFIYVPFKTKPLRKELSTCVVSTFLPLMFSRMCKVRVLFGDE